MGLTDPILSKNKKIILQNFGLLDFSFIYSFLIFEKKKEIKHLTYINSQN